MHAISDSPRTLFQSKKEWCRQARDYYKMHIRQNFIAHDDESDGERIAEIMSKARKDAKWIVDKVQAQLQSE